METVYIETTIPSLYFDDRKDAKTVARREWTRSWWDNCRDRYQLVTGLPVIEELSKGNHPQKAEKLTLMEAVEILPITEAVVRAVEVYIERYVMPRDPAGDAAHLALASVHKCDYLLTWNCRPSSQRSQGGSYSDDKHITWPACATVSDTTRVSRR